MANEIKYKVGFDVNHSDLNKLKSSLQQLQKLSISDIMKINNVDSNAAITTLGDITREAGKVQDALNKAFNVKLGTVNIEAFNKALHDSTTSMDQVYETFKKGGTAGENTFRTLANEVTKTNIQLKQSHSLLDNIATTLTNTIKWNLASSAVNTMSQSIQQAWGYVKNLDNSLNDIRIVTNKSAEQMANFAVQANQAAQSLGKTTTDYTKAALIYAQQGLSDEEIAARTAVTLKTANVTGQSTAEVSEQLTAVWNGYKVNAEQAEVYVDRLAAVAATTASDLQELSTGMSKVASAAAAMGVGEDQLAAQLSTIISVTRQAPESIGTALRTIYARITDIKAGIDEEGVDLGRYSGKMAELGFNVLDATGNLRDMGQVMEEIGYKWQDLTREQQVSLAQTMAGQRQYSNLIALFDNFDKYTEALNTAREAAGTLNEQQDIYLERTSTHLTQLKTATQNLYDSLLNPQALNPLIDSLTSVVNLAASFVDSIGGGASVLTLLGTTAVTVFSQQISSGIMTFISNLNVARQNSKQITQMLESIGKFGNLNGLDESTKKILSQKEELYRLASAASPEQFNEIQGLIDKITQLSNQITILKEKKKDIDKIIGTVGSQTSIFTNVEDTYKNKEAQDAILDAVVDQEEEFQKARKAFSKYKDELAKTDDVNDKIKQSYDKATSAANNYLEKLQTIVKNNSFYADSTKGLDNLIQRFKQLSQIEPEDLTDDQRNELDLLADKITQVAQKAQKVAKETGDQLTAEFQETGESIRKQLTDTQAAATDAANKITKEFSNIKINMKAEDITKMVGGFGQLISSVQILQNLGKSNSIGQIFQNLTIGLPMLISGTSKVATAMGLLKFQTDAVAAAASSAKIKIELLNGTLLMNPWTIAIAGVTALTAGLIALANRYEQANKAAIEHNKAIIEEEKAKEQQLNKNKQLLESVQQLSREYENGQIETRVQLRAEIDKLINQYGLEEDYIDKLIEKYGNLEEGIRQARIEAERQRKTTLENQEFANYSNIVPTIRETSATTKIGSDLYTSFNFTNNNEYETNKKLVEALRKSGFGLNFDSQANVYTGMQSIIGSNPEDVLQLYQAVTEAIGNANLSIDEKQTQFAQQVLGWVAEMQEVMERELQLRDNIAESQQAIAIRSNQNSDFSNVSSLEQYRNQRNALIQNLVTQSNIDREIAVKQVDNELKNFYSDLYTKYNSAVKYYDELVGKFGNENAKVFKALSSLNPQQLSYLKDFGLSTGTINNWEDLANIIQRISNIDLSNLSPINGETTVDTATDNYNFYQSLEDQVKSGKSISKTTFEGLSPELQQFFDKMANGSYRMTENAKEFYATVDSLKLQGFFESIASINKEIEKNQSLGKLSQSSFDYDKINSLAVKTRENGSSGRGQYDYDLVNQQLKYLQIVAETNKELDVAVDLWKQHAEAHELTYKQITAIRDAVSEATDQTEGWTDQTDQLSEKLRQAQQRLYDAMFPTDADVDESALAQLSNTLQELAPQSAELADILFEDSRAADQLAQSILRFDNAIQDVVDHYDEWILALSQENLALGDQAVLLPQLRDAYADMLDLDGSLLTDDFLLSTQNLEWMKAAIDGDIQAYENLAEAARVAAIQALKLDPSIDMSHFEEDIAYLENYLNNRQNFPSLEIGAQLNDQKFLEELSNMLNTMGVTAKQASDILRENLGIDAEVIEEKVETKDVQRQVGFDANFQQVTAPFNAVTIDSRGNIHNVPGTYTGQGLYYTPVEETVTVPKENSAFTLKVTSAHKSAGGQFKYTHASRGAGSAGITRRTEAAAKAAKAAKKAEVKPDTSTKDTKDYAKDDRDIYHDINIEISEINRELERIQKIQDRLFGKQLIANLNKQTDILEKQKVKLREKINLQKQDLAQQKEKLKALGATFDAEDRISNYFDLLGNQQGVINGLVDAYNAVVAQYNATTDKTAKDALKDQLTEADRLLKDAQDYYKEIQTAIKNYDSLRDDMEDLVDEVTQIAQKQIELNIRRFRMQLEIRLDMGQAERDWNEFRRHIQEGGGLLDGYDNILKDSPFEILMRDANLDYNNLESYFGIHGNNRGQIQTLTDQIEGTLAQLDELEKSGDAAIYGDRKKQLLDDLQTDLSSLTGKMQDIQDLINNIDQAYLDTYKDIKNQMDEQIEDYQFLDGVIEHDIDLLQLLYGDRQYAAMDSYYSQQHENQLQEIDFLRQSIDMVKERLQVQQLAGNENAVKQLKQEYKDLVNDLNSLVEASVQTLRDKYTNAINQIFDQLDKQVTGGMGIDYLQMEWELMNKNANEYLDAINSAFAIQELQLKYTKIINDDKSVKNQKALQQVLDEQLKNLRDKDKLTQYDVDRAEKVLQIEQARLALEDQRKNKTSLRLRRDSQGNYSYVYAANQEQIANAEEALAKAQNDLYNFDKNAYQKNLEDILAAWRDFQTRYKEIVLDTSLTEEQRVRQLAELRDQYGEYINGKVEENEVIRTNLKASAFDNYINLYHGDQEAYESMINNEDQLMGKLVFSWDSNVQKMADKFAGEGGFIPTCEGKLNQLAQVTRQYYDQDLKRLEEAAGTHFSALRDGAIDPTITSFKQLVKQNDELIKKFQAQLTEISTLKTNLQQLAKLYDNVWKAADAAATKAHEALRAQNEQAAQAAKASQNYKPPTITEQPQSLPAAPTTVPASIPAATPVSSPTQQQSSADSGSSFNETVELTKAPLTLYEGLAGAIYHGLWGSRIKQIVNENMVDVWGINTGTTYFSNAWKKYQSMSANDFGPASEYASFSYDYLKKKQKWLTDGNSSTTTKKVIKEKTKPGVVLPFDTGGYTGSWGTEGRLAMLHQKELVLNADDTKNMLDSVAILRGIVDNLGGNISTRLSSLNSSFNNINNNRSTETLDQNVSIQATFPNVNSKREIEEALNDLVNLAAQRAMKRS